MDKEELARKIGKALESLEREMNYAVTVYIGAVADEEPSEIVTAQVTLVFRPLETD